MMVMITTSRSLFDLFRLRDYRSDRSAFDVVGGWISSSQLSTPNNMDL